MKIRYMKDKVKTFKLKISRNFNSFFICILAFMLNFKFISDINIRLLMKTKEKKSIYIYIYIYTKDSKNGT